jgi:hypothetical protein
MKTFQSRLSSQRGAVLIHVGIALLGLIAFATFVADYGVMWVGRSESQTAADAAVLAAARSLAFDGTPNFPHIKSVGQQVGLANHVFGAAPTIALSDITFPICPPTLTWATDTCVKADVSRTLPVFFAPIVGVTSQHVRATATARAVAANATNCLKPWAVGDKWFDTQVGGWSQTATYVPAVGDVYTPPSATSPGTGFTEHDAAGNPTYYGYQMIMKLSNPGQGANQIPINSAGWAMELALNNAASNNPASTPAYNANITGCTSDIVAISPPGGVCGAQADPAHGCLAVKTGSTGGNNAKSVADYIAANDPTATWSDGASGWQTGHINSSQSPSSRVVPVAIFHVPEYLAGNYTGSNGIARIVNIVGFFLEGTCQTVAFKEAYLKCPGGGNDKAAIVGRLVSYPALIVATGGTVIGSFGSIIVLVR